MGEQSNWVETLAGRPVEPMKPLESVEDVVAARAWFAEVFATPPSPLPEDVRLERVTLTDRGGRELTAEVCVPAGDGPFPPLLYLHDGGWCAGKVENERDFCVEVAQHGFVVASLDYALAPEHAFPWAVEDAVYGLRWLAGHAADYGGDPARLAIGGSSAGANIGAAALVANASDEPLVDGGDLEGVRVDVAAALFLYGAYDFRALTMEPADYADLIEMMFNLAYLGPHFLSRHHDPLVSPRFSEHLDRFPPTYLTCGDRDGLLPQSFYMARALVDAGVPTTVSVVAGVDHFIRIRPRPAAVTAEVERMTTWLAGQTAAS
jgi:acetyl esterase